MNGSNEACIGEHRSSKNHEAIIIIIIRFVAQVLPLYYTSENSYPIIRSDMSDNEFLKPCWQLPSGARGGQEGLDNLLTNRTQCDIYNLVGSEIRMIYYCTKTICNPI